MKQLRNLFLALAPIVAVLLLGATQFTAQAAEPNLLAGKNPRFEQGLANWTVLQTSGDTLVTKMVSGKAKASCGEQVLLTKGNTNTASINSAFVPLEAATDYRFTIWLKIKDEGTVANLIAYEQDPANPANNKSEVLVSNITTTDKKWVKYTGTFTSMDTPGEARLTVAFVNGAGRLSLDCAAIKPVPVEA